MQEIQPNLVPGTICMRDAIYPTFVTKRYVNRKKWESPNPNIVRAYIPGTVLRVLVAKGDRVKKGDKLAVFVAMKMHNDILSPHSGEVADVFVKEGDKLPKGAGLFEVKP